MSRWLLPAVLTGLLASLAGCQRIETRTTAYLSVDVPGPAPGRTVAVVAESRPREPLLEREVERKIEHLLATRGCAVAPEDTADYVLAAFFSIDTGRIVTDTYEVYRPGETVTESVYGRHGRIGTVYRHYPPYSQQRVVSYTRYTRFLELNLFDRRRDFEKNPDGALAWRATVLSPGSESDLRQMIDFLLIAAFDHFNADTGCEVEKTFNGGDVRVRELRAAVRPGRQ